MGRGLGQGLGAVGRLALPSWLRSPLAVLRVKSSSKDMKRSSLK